MENSSNLREGPNDPHATASGRSGPSVTLIIFGVIAVLALVFFLQNSESVSIDFLVFEKNTTIRWSILMATVLGIVLDRLFSMWWRRRSKKKDDN